MVYSHFNKEAAPWYRLIFVGTFGFSVMSKIKIHDSR